MRAIKFKRYHFDSDKKLISVTQWGKIIKSFRVYEDSELCFTMPSNIGNTDSFVDCQYTGLKDKNGEELYENDTIRILYSDWSSKSESDPRTLEQYLIDISEIGVVEFNDNAWEVKIYSKKYDDYSHRSISHGIHGRIEKIGNIHEHSHLLKQ